MLTKKQTGVTTMTFPVERMGPEIGWTTLHYYSKHDEVRRDIWRDQWKSRQKLEDNDEARYTAERRRIEGERQKRSEQLWHDRKEWEEREKRVFQRQKDKHKHTEQMYALKIFF